MRSLWTALSIVLLLHALALAGFAWWLRHTGRLNRDRLERVVAMLRTTVPEEQEAETARQEQARAAAEQAAEDAWLRRVAEDATTTAERIARRRLEEELAGQAVEKARADLEALKRQIALAQAQLQQQQDHLDARKREVEAFLAEQQRLQKDEHFQKALDLLQRVRARQAKEMFQTWLAQGNTDQVVDYLAAMSQKKASDVLKEFKTSEEVAQATDLVERLRRRGVVVASPATEHTAPGAAPSGDVGGGQS